MLTKAQQQQYVRVQVNLDVDIPLMSPDKLPAHIQAKLATKENKLLAELGSSVLQTTIWRTGLGQMGFHASPEGLKRLAASSAVRSFETDFTDDLRNTVYDWNGRLKNIENEIDKNGFADVEVILNLDNFDVDIGSDGKAIHRPSNAQKDETRMKVPSLLASLPSRAVLNLEQAKSDADKTASADPVVRLRINKEGYYLLKEHGQVRGLRLASESEITPITLDPEALQAAEKIGYADVTIDLQRFSGYTPMQGKLSANAWQSQVTGIRKALVDTLSKLEPDAVNRAQDFGGLGSASVRLSVASLKLLYQNPDPRIMGVRLNKPLGTTMLAESTAKVNMPQAWNKGYTGSGQTIAIFDTGIDKTHPFLQDTNGNPKVIFEACFSAPPGMYSNSVSLCLNPDTNGDSPVGLSGSGVNCPSTIANCFHGTHVASIAAGKRGWNGLSGMAPDAKLVSVQVFSRFMDPVTKELLNTDVRFINEDLVKGLQTLVNNGGSGEITANLSLGSPAVFPTTCTQFEPLFNAAVSNLVSMRIPVVAGSGNGTERVGVSWPACAPGVIKVAASYDFSDAIWGASNLVNPTALDTGLFLAPGCTITAATIGGGTDTACGTSMATAHMSGLFAAIKSAWPGVSVADATAYIRNNGVDTPAFGLGYNLKQIRVPNL